MAYSNEDHKDEYGLHLSMPYSSMKYGMHYSECSEWGDNGPILIESQKENSMKDCLQK